VKGGLSNLDTTLKKQKKKMSVQAKEWQTRIGVIRWQVFMIYIDFGMEHAVWNTWKTWNMILEKNMLSALCKSSSCFWYLGPVQFLWLDSIIQYRREPRDIISFDRTVDFPPTHSLGIDPPLLSAQGNYICQLDETGADSAPVISHASIAST
jgi:hypothetical protein